MCTMTEISTLPLVAAIDRCRLRRHCKLTSHDKYVARVPISLKEAIVQQHAAIGLRDSADDELHGSLALPS